MVKNPPKVKQDLILFTSSEDYSGNPRALFQYMIEHGYNKRYKMVWLFEDVNNKKDFNIPNVSSVCMYTDSSRNQRTAAAQKAALTARYLFYSHNLNWVRNFRKEQTYIDLWHGCGYKGELKRDKTRVYYDYLMVTGKKYIDIFRDVMNDPEGNILDLGYPRNEMMLRGSAAAGGFMEELKEKNSAKKVIIWMPTYRKSHVQRLSTEVELGETGLPVVYNWNELQDLNQVCKDSSVLVVIKKHPLQLEYIVESKELSNILLFDGREYRNLGIDLYELLHDTDAMITDYSSAAIDYMLLDKAIGFTLDDYDMYKDARGWSFDNVKDYMPGHHISDMDGLKDFIKDVSEGKDPHREWRKRITPEVHTYTDDFSSRILEYFDI